MTEVYLCTEAASDARTVAVIVDRICDPDAIEFRGIDQETPFDRRSRPGERAGFTQWKHLKHLPGPVGRRGQAGQYIDRWIRKVVLVATDRGRRHAHIILVEDDDGCGLAEQVEAWHGEYGEFATLIIGIPQPELEMWHLHAFDPRDTDEQARLAAQRRALGADPRDLDPATVHAGRTHHKQTGEAIKRNAKNILAALTDDDPHRADDGLAITALDTLRDRGARSGLAAFVDAVERQLTR